MFDTKKQNPTCSFTEEVITYVYDEMETSEKAEFETHLVNCSPCADEISAFSSVSFSIKEWRDETFSSMQTPVITIPYEKTNKAEVIATESTSIRWFDNFRKLFTLSPALLKTATAFGTIAISIGLAWVLTISFTENDKSLADKTNNTQEQKNKVVTQSEGKKPKTFNDELVNDDNKQVTPINETKESKKAFKTITAKPTKVKLHKSIKKRRINKKLVAKTEPKTQSNKKKALNKKKKLEDLEIREVPRLTDFAMDETEDTDIRLTDFFEDDESDTK